MPCAALLESWNSRNSAPSMQRHSFCISRRLADTRSWPSIRSIKKMAGLLALLVAYLIGSIPFGYLMVKLSTGKDVRNAGSGNIGATNVLRTTGRAPAVATLLLDIAKGYLAVRSEEHTSELQSRLH